MSQCWRPPSPWYLGALPAAEGEMRQRWSDTPTAPEVLVAQVVETNWESASPGAGMVTSARFWPEMWLSRLSTKCISMHISCWFPWCRQVLRCAVPLEGRGSSLKFGVGIRPDSLLENFVEFSNTLPRSPSTSADHCSHPHGRTAPTCPKEMLLRAVLCALPGPLSSSPASSEALACLECCCPFHLLPVTYLLHAPHPVSQRGDKHERSKAAVEVPWAAPHCPFVP